MTPNFDLWSAEGFAIVEVDEECKIPLFSGYRLRDRWPVLSGRLGEGTRGDFSYLGPGVLACRRSSWAVLSDAEPSLRFEVESLPIELDNADEPYLALNVINVRPCLDMENSVVQYIPGTRRVMRVLAYRLVEKEISNALLFKVPELVRTTVFCSAVFRDLVIARGMTGLRFETIPLV